MRINMSRHKHIINTTNIDNRINAENTERADAHAAAPRVYHIYIYVYVCMYVYVCIYIYIYIYI